MAKLYALAAILGLLFAGWIGYQLCDSGWNAREAEIAKAYVSNQNAAVKATREKIEASNKRALQEAQKRAMLEKRHLEETYEYELTIARSDRAGCRVDDESFRLLAEAIDRANRAIIGDTSRVSENMPSNAEASRPE